MLMLANYAATFGQLPSVVRQESFDDVVPIVIGLNKQNNYHVKRAEIKKKYNAES